MRKQVDKAQGALPCFLASLFPCLLIYLSTNKNAPPPATCQGRGVILAVPPCLSRQPAPLNRCGLRRRTARHDNGGVSGTTYYASRSRFTLHALRFARPTPRPIRRRRGCLVHTLGGSLKPGLPLFARFTVVHFSVGASMPQPRKAVKQRYGQTSHSTCRSARFARG